MSKQRRLLAVLSGLLIGLGFRALAKALTDNAPSREKAITVALLITLILTAGCALLWALGLI